MQKFFVQPIANSFWTRYNTLIGKSASAYALAISPSGEMMGFQIAENGGIPMKKLLAMVLAVAMTLSLCVFPVGAEDSYVNKGGTLYGSAKAAETYKDIQITVKEESSGPYKVGSLIKYLVTFKNTSTTQSKEFKKIKIVNYNTNDAVTYNFPGVEFPSTGNVQYSIIAYGDSAAGVHIDGDIQNLNYKSPYSNTMMKEENYRTNRKTNNQVDYGNEDLIKIIMPAGSSFQFYMEFLVQAEDKGKTLINLLGFHLDETNADHSVGAFVESSADRVSNEHKGNLVIQNTMTGGDSGDACNYKITIEDKDYTGSGTGSTSVTLSEEGNAKTGNFSLKNGETVTFSDLTDATEFTVEQTGTNGKSYTTKNAVSTSNLSAGTETSTTASGTITGTESSATTTYVGFFNTIAGGGGTSSSGKVTYHLNLPEDVRTDGVTGGITQYQDASGKFKDFTYPSESTEVLELNEIDKFTSGDVTITGNKTTPNPGDDFVSYPQGYLGSGNTEEQAKRYYFVGWSRTPNAVFNANGTVNYKNIDFPVVYLKGSGDNQLGVRAIYGYRTDDETTKLNGSFTVDSGTNLYAVWTNNTNSGLMGYALQIDDAYFNSADDKTKPVTTTDGHKLVFGGCGKDGAAWYKYVDLDGGHQDGGEYTITTDVPKYTGSNSAYVSGTTVATAFAAWKVNDGGKEGKNDWFVANGGQTVKYTGGGTTVSSLDAMWATTTAPGNQTVGYTGDPQAPSFSALETKFNNNYDRTNKLKQFAANDTSTERSPFISYEISVAKEGSYGDTSGSTSTTTAKGLNGVSVPTVTKPGVYRYTIKAKYSVKNPANPDAVSNATGAFTNELGTVSFLFIVQPQLTLNITKDLTGRAWTAGDSFEFTVSVDGSVATVTESPITVTESGKTGTAYVDFSGVTSTQTFTITVAETKPSSSEPGMTYASDQTVKVTATVDSATGFITLGNAGGTGDVNAVADAVTGNLKADVTMTNTYVTPGSLTVKKEVVGDTTATNFGFTVTFDDWTPTETWATGNVTGAVAGSVKVDGNKVTFNLAKGGTATLNNIPNRTKYTVTEDTSDATKTTYKVNGSVEAATGPATGTIANDKTSEVVVTNYYTGSLTINKTVKGEGPAVPTNGTFTFTITAPEGLIAAGTTFNLGGSAGTVTFADGKTATVEITVSGGTSSAITGSVTIENLPIGTYTVTETVPAGYQVEGGNSKPVTLTTSGATAEFTNTYQTGTLQITKTVDGIASASGKEFTFTITAPKDKIADGTKFTVGNAKDSQITFNSDGTATVTIVMGTDSSKTVTIANLPAGSYTVEETAMADNYTVDGAASKTVTISGGSTDNVTITNKHDTGDLTITKNVTGGTNVKVSQTFTFTVKAPENLIKSGASFTVDNGTAGKGAVTFNTSDGVTTAEVTVTLTNSDTGSVTIKDLPVGKYTITENVPTGYTTTTGSVTADVAKGTTPVTVTNTVQTTSLTIGKTVVYPTDFPADKKLDANVVEYTFTVTFKDFPAGVTSFELNVGSTSKTVTTADNIVTFKLKAGVQTELKNIPIGIGYEVTEAFQSDDLGRHFTTEWTHQTGTLNSSTTVTCTNTYHMLEVGNGALVIRKEAVGGKADTKYQFKVTFTQGGKPYIGQINGQTLGSDGSATFEMDDTANHSLVIQVPVGVAYKVEEVFASGEKPKAISVRLEQDEAGDSTSGETASGTISQEFNYDSVIFTNRYLGNLTISKTVPQFDGGEEFTFTVTLPTGTYNYTGSKSGTISSGGTVTLKAGESITIQNLPAGSSYTVTEAGTANYKTESVDATGTIANNTTAEAKFTNTRNTGSLTVNKTLTGKLAAEDDTFTFTVTLTGVGAGFTGDCGEVKFTNGVGTFTITGAGSQEISGLPVGAGFTVKEDLATGYVTTYRSPDNTTSTTEAEGTISANPTTVTVNNDKPDTGTITIKKVVENAPAGSDEVFNFTITLYAEDPTTHPTQTPVDIDGPHGVFTFTKGVAEFSLKNGESVVGEGEVTVGEGQLFYKIKETADPNYTTTSTTSDTEGEASGSVVTGEFTQDSQNTTVIFTNTYKASNTTPGDGGGDSGGGTGGTGSTPKPPVVDGPKHYAYIIGKPDGTVDPSGEITRAEVATIIFRLLKEEVRAANWSKTNTFPDVAAAAWYNNAISTLQNMKAVEGGDDGLFHPEAPITRAEIAAMLVRLHEDLPLGSVAASSFTDVDPDAWYAGYVAAAEELGLVIGDGTGNFRPEDSLTRAEAMTMFNRLLDWRPHKDHLLPDDQMTLWPDNQDKDVWYYADVQEATNSHSCASDGVTVDGKTYEKWEELLPNRDWAALEREWSEANSGL